MLSGKCPFTGKCGIECGWDKGQECHDCQQYLFERIQEGVYDFPSSDWGHVSEDAKDLIRHLLEHDVTMRYSAADVLHHSWITGQVPATQLCTPTLLKRNNSVRDIDKYADEALAINRMVEQSYGNVSMCLSKSSSFYLDHDQVEMDLKAVVNAADLAATPTGSPDDDEENSLRRKQSASSLFFRGKLQDSLNSMNQQQNPIFKIGDEDDDDENEDYNNQLCQDFGLKIGENELLHDSRMLHASNSAESKLNNTVTAPIDMRIGKVQSQSDLDDQTLSSTLKESNMLISSSSSSGGSCSENNNRLSSGSNGNVSNKKKNNRKRRQRKRESQMKNQEISIPDSALLSTPHKEHDIKKTLSENTFTPGTTNESESPPIHNQHKTLQYLNNEEDIFSEYYENGTSNNQENEIEHGEADQFEFFDDEDDDLESSEALNVKNKAIWGQQQRENTNDLVLNDYEFGEFENEDEYSSGADYFLASSVDTVINAPYMINAFKEAKSANSNSNTTQSIPMLSSKSQNSLASSVSSYTNSVAKDFLNDNKMNVNSNSHKSVNNINNNNQNPRNHEHTNVSQQKQIPVNAETNKKQNSQQVRSSSNTINNQTMNNNNNTKGNSKSLQKLSISPKTPSAHQQFINKNHQPESNTNNNNTKPIATRQASKPMQFINSFVSAVASGAMLMMSSNPASQNQAKIDPAITSTSTPKKQNTVQKNSSNKYDKDANNKMIANPNEKLIKHDLAVALELETESRDKVASKVQLSSLKESQLDQSSSSYSQDKANLEVEVNSVAVVNPVTINDVNKKTNRKSYSEVILTESSIASSMNSDFRTRPNSMSLNSFNNSRTNCATPSQKFNGQYNNNNFNNNCNRQNRNNYNMNNRHSVCVSAPTSTKNSSNFETPNSNPFRTKTKAKSFNYNNSYSNNINVNRQKFNKPFNINTTKKKK